MARVHLTDTQREAVRAGAGNRWLGAMETGVQGSTMVALERKGMAQARWTTRPYRRLIYRLTAAGVAERRRLAPITVATEDEQRRAAPMVAAIERRQRELEPAFAELVALFPPAVSEGVRCRCTHCGAEWPDATPGGSCGTCGQAVVAL